jgi:hypothetical protein
MQELTDRDPDQMIVSTDLVSLPVGTTAETSPELTSIRIKADFQNKNRRIHPASQARLDLDREEWRTGKHSTFDNSLGKDKPWRNPRQSRRLDNF